MNNIIKIGKLSKKHNMIELLNKGIILRRLNNMIDENIIDKNIIDKNIIDKNIIDENVIDENVIEDLELCNIDMNDINYSKNFWELNR